MRFAKLQKMEIWTAQSRRSFPVQTIFLTSRRRSFLEFCGLWADWQRSILENWLTLKVETP